MKVTVPGIGAEARLVAEGHKPGSRGPSVPARTEKGALVFTVTPELAGRWLHVLGVHP